MMMIIGLHDFRAPLEPSLRSGRWRGPMRGVFQGGGISVDSWTPGPKPLCHRHPTGPHPSGLLWTPAKAESTKSNFALTAEGRDLRQEGTLVTDGRQAGGGGPGVEAAGGVFGVVG